MVNVEVATRVASVIVAIPACFLAIKALVEFAQKKDQKELKHPDTALQERLGQSEVGLHQPAQKKDEQSSGARAPKTYVLVLTFSLALSAILFSISLALKIESQREMEAVSNASQVILGVQESEPRLTSEKDALDEIAALQNLANVTHNLVAGYLCSGIQEQIGRHHDSIDTLSMVEREFGRQTASTQCAKAHSLIELRQFDDAKKSLDSALLLSDNGSIDPFARSSSKTHFAIQVDYVLLFVSEAKSGGDMKGCLDAATPHYRIAESYRQEVDERGIAALESNLAVLNHLLAKDEYKRHGFTPVAEGYLEQAADHFKDEINGLSGEPSKEYIEALFSYADVLCAIPTRRQDGIATLEFLTSVLDTQNSNLLGAAFLLIADGWSDMMQDASTTVECNQYRARADEALKKALEVSQAPRTKNNLAKQLAQKRIAKLEGKYQGAIDELRRRVQSRPPD